MPGCRPFSNNGSLVAFTCPFPVRDWVCRILHLHLHPACSGSSLISPLLISSLLSLTRTTTGTTLILSRPILSFQSALSRILSLPTCPRGPRSFFFLCFPCGFCAVLCLTRLDLAAHFSPPWLIHIPAYSNSSLLALAHYLALHCLASARSLQLDSHSFFFLLLFLPPSLRHGCPRHRPRDYRSMSIADAHAEASWASWLPLCCMPMSSSDNKTCRKLSLNTISTTGRGESWPLGRLSDEELLMGQDEKPTHDTVICDQPLHHPLPTPAPEMSFHQRTMGEKASRNNTAPKKRRFLSISSTSTTHKGHRPTISAPTHFRHISTGSPQFTFPEPRSKPKIKTHRPTISAPTHFRHVSTGSPFSEPIPTMPNLPTQASNMPPARLRRRRSFRPLELSIHLPENKISPIMTHFAKEDKLRSPAPVYDPERMEREPRNGTVSPPETPERTEKLPDSDSESSPPPIPPSRLSTLHRRSASTSDLTASDKSTSGPRPLEHQRSFSAMSFHFPRKPVAETTNSTPSPILEDDDIPPLIPPKARNRARAHTSPDVEAIRERVASAMIEVEQLQRQIDNVLERQSLYCMSRPSTSHSAANTMPELEPMPSIPALPPAAPSFAERLNSEIERPRTAPIKSHVHTHRRARTMENAPPRPHTPPMRKARRSEIPLPPPLPLVLRPPLRKKKSFSRVSTWLFPGGESGTDRPMDSVTNNPRPVTGKDGFYQCVSLADAHGRRHSDESLGTVTTWNSDDDRTVPSAWSPTSTAVTKGDELFVPRTATTGGNCMVSPLASVGVAV